MHKKTCMYFSILFLIVTTTGCRINEDNDMELYKNEVIDYINSYYENIDNKYTQYSTIFIENEIKDAKNKIFDSLSKEEIDYFKEKCIEEINNLILDDNEKNEILNSYCTWEYFIEASDAQTQIKYYLGEYDSKHIVIVSGPCAFVWIPEQRYYTLITETKIFNFKPLPEVIGVSYSNQFYILSKASDSNIFGDNVILADQAMKIYERYLLLTKN